MKRKLLLQFADWLEQSRGPFNITRSRCCVAAFALRFACVNKLPGARRMLHGSSSSDLVDIFGLGDHEADELYAGGFDWFKAGQITRKVAAQVIRKLARTGKVDFGKLTNPTPDQRAY